MEEYLMNQKTLRELLERLTEDTNEVAKTNKTKKKYLAEIKDIENTAILTEAWAKLLTSKVFNRFIGSWEKVDGNIVYIKSVA